ncbi:hypothetical protein [Microbulbifer sp. SAOS-129_SWC]|uniref:hypothetical protein n=1 Tax=Microbulbifer sp. SAOS-129_SWC TaxID=3145235 RepID=UPI003217B398
MRANLRQQLQIADMGMPLTLDYEQALAEHGGESWFGVAVAFRMLQAAGRRLSRQRLWDRQGLWITSGHPGRGVRDAVETVTRCVSRNCYRVEREEIACGRGMRFAWWVEQGGERGGSVSLSLRDDFVPEELYQLLERIDSHREQRRDRVRFAALKWQLAEQVWREPLARLFRVEEGMRTLETGCRA